MKNIVVVLGLALVLIGAILVLPIHLRNHPLQASDPSGKYIAFALPFKGSSPHPLGGKLRVFLISRQQSSPDKHQTSLPRTSLTHLEWVPGATHPTFRIRDQSGTRMVWRVEHEKAVCVEGLELLAPDPYANEFSPR